jgi:hypothetical protein
MSRDKDKEELLEQIVQASNDVVEAVKGLDVELSMLR